MALAQRDRQQGGVIDGQSALRDQRPECFVSSTEEFTPYEVRKGVRGDWWSADRNEVGRLKQRSERHRFAPVRAVSAKDVQPVGWDAAMAANIRTEYAGRVFGN
ncbi:MAG: hypothetical protein WDO56_09780 [Gammaproteobacteria bacterium]